MDSFGLVVDRENLVVFPGTLFLFKFFYCVYLFFFLLCHKFYLKSLCLRSKEE